MDPGIQPSISNMKQNPNMSPGMQSLGMQQDNFATIILGQSLGYQQFPQLQQQNQQQGLQPYNQNLAQQ